MTATLFEYPSSAAFGRVLPKSKIYEHSGPGTKLKQLFVRQVEQIVWQYKLAPETINLRGMPFVREIQIFSVALKDEDLKQEILQCIDRAIPFPIFFELRYQTRIRGVAAYKRPSEADGTKWIISDYFETSWMPSDAPRKPLPLVLDLESLYGRLLRTVNALSAQGRRGTEGQRGENGTNCLEKAGGRKM